MEKVRRKIAAVTPIREAGGKKGTARVKEAIIDIASIPAFLILFVIAMLYAGILFLFRVKDEI